MWPVGVAGRMSRVPVWDAIDVSREFFLSLGAPGLLAVAFLEFFLFPIPPVLLLIPLTVATPELALVYAGVATLGSVSAGVVGYGIGLKGGRPILTSRFSSERVGRAEAYFERNGFATIAIGSFAPIPEAYELLSFGAGVLGVRFRTYLLAAVLGRGGKYLVVATLVVAIGEAARSLSEAELYGVIGVVSLVAVLAYLLRDRWVPAQWRGTGE